jgi:hypothetical protein
VDLATARARLERMVQKDVAPTLSATEIDDLMLMARRNDADGYAPYSTWAASTVYTVNAARVPSVNNGHYYTVTTAGTSGATEPTWPTASAGTVVDGTVTWTERGAYLWTGTWDLRAAAAEGWRWKAAKLVSEYDVAAGGGTNFLRDQKFKHCQAMIQLYGGGSAGSGSGIGTIQLTSGYAGRTGD